MENSDAERLLGERREEIHKRQTGQDIRQWRSIYWMRLILRVLSFATCLAIIYFLIDGILSYKRTKDVTNLFRDGSGTFQVWPPNLKLWPSYILLAAAVVAGTFSLILLFASCFRKVRHMTKTGNITTVVISSICLVVWVTVTAYYGSWDTKTTNWDLLSWTCTHQDPKYDYKDIDFSQMCTEMRFALWAGVALAALEAFNLGIFVLWCCGTRKSRNYKKMPGKDSMNVSLLPVG